MFNWVAPVKLPPGRLRLAARPSCTGSLLVVKTMGMVVVAAFAAIAAGVLVGGNHAHLTTNEFARQCRQSIVLALCPVVFDRDVAPLDVTRFIEALAER